MFTIKSWLCYGVLPRRVFGRSCGPSPLPSAQTGVHPKRADADMKLHTKQLK